MTDIQKQAVKDLLHLLVDKEEGPVVLELLSKLPAPYAGMAAAIAPALLVPVIAQEDKLIDGI